MTGDTKSCPACAEKIQVEANKCRYCGEWIHRAADVDDPPGDGAQTESRSLPKEKSKSSPASGLATLGIPALLGFGIVAILLVAQRCGAESEKHREASGSLERSLGSNQEECSSADDCRVACDKGVADSCTRLAELAETGPNADWVETARTYARGCELGSSASCARLAKMHRYGHGVKRDNGLAIKLGEKACLAGNKAGCAEQLLALPMNAEEQGKELADQACNNDSAWGCALLARFGHPDADALEAKATALWMSECEQRERGGCVEFAIQLYRNERDEEADKILEKVCQESDGEACDFRALSSKMLGDPPSQVAHFRKLACDAGFLDSCAEVGRFEFSDFFLNTVEQSEVNKTVESTKANLQRTCERGGWSSCVALGDIEAHIGDALRARARDGRRGTDFLSGSGWWEAEFYSRAFYRKACDMAEQHACARLGYMYQQNRGIDDGGRLRFPFEGGGAFLERRLKHKPDPENAAHQIAEACEDGFADFGDSCAYLGHFQEQGIGLQQDLGLAAATYRRACDAGSPLGCTELARMYSKGLGVERNRHEAKRWTKEAKRMIERRMNLKYPVDVGTPR